MTGRMSLTDVAKPSYGSHGLTPGMKEYRSHLDNPAYVALRPLLERSHPAIHHVDAHTVMLKPEQGAALSLAKKVAYPFVWICPPTMCCVGKVIPILVPEGSIAITENNGVPEFLGLGWHWLASPFRKLHRIASLKEEVISFGPKSIVTIPPGRVGYCTNEGEAILLGPGMHQWDHPTISFVGSYDISEALVEMGPYTLVTVREGQCAVTRRNGVLEILGAEKLMGTLPHDAKPLNRTYLLDHQQWRFVAWLNTTEQFDCLKANELLTADRVEVDLESTVAWRIVDPVIAAKQGGGMDYIRNLVHREARATVADLILSTKMSTGIRPPESRAKTESRTAVLKEKERVPDPDAEREQGEGFDHGGVSTSAVDACSRRLERIGVHVDTINIVQLNIQDKNIRERLAQAAVISTKVQETSEIAKTEAKNLEISARASAEAQRLKARAEADSIEFIAQAKAKALKMHAQAAKEAGELIQSNTVATELEHIRVTGDALANCRSTLFLSPGQDLSGLLSNPAVTNPNASVGGGAQRSSSTAPLLPRPSFAATSADDDADE